MASLVASQSVALILSSIICCSVRMLSLRKVNKSAGEAPVASQVIVRKACLSVFRYWGGNLFIRAFATKALLSMPGLRPGRPRPTPRFTLLGSVWERRMNAYKLHHTLPSKKDHSPNYCSELPCGSKAWQEVISRQLCLLLIKKVKCSHVKGKLNPKSRKRALRCKTGN